jgi:hypothetical protein
MPLYSLLRMIAHQLKQIAVICCVVAGSTSTATGKSKKQQPSDLIWPQPLIPILPFVISSGTTKRQIYVINTGFGPPARQPAPRLLDLPRLRADAASVDTETRLTALASIAEVFEAEFYHDAVAIEQAVAAYQALLSDPAFDTWAFADAELFRSAMFFNSQPDRAPGTGSKLLRRLQTDYPNSKLVVAAEYQLGLHAFETGKFKLAVPLLAHAAANSAGPLQWISRWNLVRAYQGLGKHSDAIAEVLTALRDPALTKDYRAIFSDVVIDSFVKTRKAKDARQFFEFIDAANLVSNLGELGIRYSQRNSHANAVRVLKDVIADPVLASDCSVKAAFLESATKTSDRQSLLAAVTVVLASPAAAGCDQVARLVFPTAWSWYQAKPKTTKERRQLLAIWDLAMKSTDDIASRQTIARDRAYIGWDVALVENTKDSWQYVQTAMQAAADVTNDASFAKGAAEADRRAKAMQ